MVGLAVEVGTFVDEDGALETGTFVDEEEILEETFSVLVIVSSFVVFAISWVVLCCSSVSVLLFVV